MARSRTLFPGCPYHLTQRGHRHRAIVLDDDDAGCCIGLVGEEMERARVKIWSWALMTNHLHLIVVPDDAEGITKAIMNWRNSYERAFHNRHGPSADLWQPGFYASVLDRQEFLWRAVRYVERNPVEARMVSRAECYAWSSAAYHCGLRDDDLLVSPEAPLKGTIANWSGWLNAPGLVVRPAALRDNPRGRRRRSGPAASYPGGGR